MHYRYMLTVSLALAAALLGAAIVPQSTGRGPMLAAAGIDAYIEAQMRAHRIPGAALAVIEGGDIVALRGYGVAAPSGRAMTAQTPVIIGSMSKAFTAVAVMQLVEAGEIELGTPVRQYIPWFALADPEGSAAITVRQLLNQTGGIPNAAGLAQCLGAGETTIEQEARNLSEVAPASGPGERFEYSNANYVVLGALVEVVSGASYGEYIEDHIFEPLQMGNSYVSQAEAEQSGLATGYQRWLGFSVPADPPYLRHALPSGYLIASAEDIAHFLVALIHGGTYEDSRVLSTEGVAELFAPAADAGDVSYGMGWVVGEVAGRKAVYHHGSTPNFHTTMLIDPDGGNGVVVLTNVNLLEVWHVGPSSVIAEGVLHLIRGEQAPDVGLGVGARYVIADIIVAFFTAVAVLSVALLPCWRRQLRDQPPHSAVSFARRVATPIVPGAIWSLTILIAFPDMSNVPGWAFWTLYQPDFAYWLIAITALAVFKVVTQVAWGYGAIKAAGEAIGWRKAAAASVVVGVGFLTLFFVVMFTSTTPANFVVGLLALVFVLELIAQPAPTGRAHESSLAARGMAG